MGLFLEVAEPTSVIGSCFGAGIRGGWLLDQSNDWIGTVLIFYDAFMMQCG